MVAVLGVAEDRERDPERRRVDDELERLYRDARLSPIGGGTREIMNEIVSKTEGY